MRTDTDNIPAIHYGVLRREIIGVLCVKAVALTLLYWFFFAPSLRPHITAPSVVTHLLSGGIEQTH